jgi:hypothetical protein
LISSKDVWTQAVRVIQVGMDSGQLAKGIHEIVRLTYIDDGKVIANTTATSAGQSGGRNTSPRMIAWSLFGLFGVVLLGTYIKWRCRHSLRNKCKERVGDKTISVNAKGTIPPFPFSSPISFGLWDSEWVEFQDSIYSPRGYPPPSSPRTLSTASCDELCNFPSNETI